MLHSTSWKATTPPGRRWPAQMRSTAAGSATYVRTLRPTTASKPSPGGNSRRSVTIKATEIRTRQDWARNAVMSGNYAGRSDKKSVSIVVLKNASQVGRGPLFHPFKNVSTQVNAVKKAFPISGWRGIRSTANGKRAIASSLVSASLHLC